MIQTQTSSTELQEALGGLAVIREHVKRRKISGGTRSDAGRQCRDTFASLKKTCRQHGLSFWDYLTDRLNGTGSFPRLADVIEYASCWLLCGICWVYVKQRQRSSMARAAVWRQILEIGAVCINSARTDQGVPGDRHFYCDQK